MSKEKALGITAASRRREVVCASHTHLKDCIFKLESKEELSHGECLMVQRTGRTEHGI